MARRTRTEIKRHTGGMPYMTQEITNIVNRIKEKTNDETLASGIYFSPTAITHIKRVLENGGIIITDTKLAEEGVNKTLLEKRNVEVKCYIDDPSIRQQAEQRGITRAEVAADYGLSVEGLKLMVIGSAPAAINHIINRRQREPMSDVCVLTAAAGFAGAIQAKEKLIDSNLSCIVVRGKNGGVGAAITVLNTILEILTGMNTRV